MASAHIHISTVTRAHTTIGSVNLCCVMCYMCISSECRRFLSTFTINCRNIHKRIDQPKIDAVKFALCPHTRRQCEQRSPHMHKSLNQIKLYIETKTSTFDFRPLPKTQNSTDKHLHLDVFGFTRTLNHVSHDSNHKPTLFWHKCCICCRIHTMFNASRSPHERSRETHQNTYETWHIRISTKHLCVHT